MSDQPDQRLPTVDEINALPAGTRFGELELLRTLGCGGFGIVYLAQDHALERLVAIKEYMPGQLAQRGQGSQVSVRSGSLMETFEIGRRSFVNEARLLARFDHRSLLKVYRFWEDHGTAYMVMPYLQGQTLRQAHREMGRAPSQDWILKQLLPVLEGLALLHAEQVFHRDIAPDNILLPADGSAPILLDFGAARRAISDRTQSFTAILKPSYAPIEQYAEAAGLRQGAWTDVYALGAMLYELVQGRPPPPATTRAISDEGERLAELAPPGYSPSFLRAIDWALGVRPQERPQSIAELRAALLGEIEAPALRPRPPVEAQMPDPERTVVIARPAPTVAPEPPPPPPPSVPPTALPEAAAAGSGGRGPLMVGLGLLLVLLLGLAAWLWSGRVAPPGGEAAVPAAEMVAAPPSVAAQPASAGSLPPVITAEQAPAQAAAPAAAVEPRPTASRPSRPIITETASPPRPTPEAATPSPQPPAAVPVARPRPQAASAPAPVAVVPAGPQDPRKACGSRVLFAMVRCIQLNCAKPEFAGHAECASVAPPPDSHLR